jgi:hypothetical protein
MGFPAVSSSLNTLTVGSLMPSECAGVSAHVHGVCGVSIDHSVGFGGIVRKVGKFVVGGDRPAAVHAPPNLESRAPSPQLGLMARSDTVLPRRQAEAPPLAPDPHTATLRS